MSYDDKISQIIKNHKLKHRLQEIGIYPNMGVKKIVGPTGPKGDIGPTGPQGNGLQIMGSIVVKRNYYNIILLVILVKAIL